MAQQQIITKPYVEELQDNDSLFINHDGALRQIKKSDADFASGADMRAEVAAREAFEAREVSAREDFEKSETEAREQFETNVGEQMAEFDANAAALQTEVDRLRGECDTLAAENRKQENAIDALIKLNKGQTYDVLEQESEAYSVDVPSGSRYVSIDKVGGHSEVIDGEIVSSQTDRVDVRGKNLFNNRDVTVYSAYLKDNGVDKIPQWFYSDDSKSIRIPCEPNTAYTISLSVESTIFRIGSTPSDLLPLTWDTGVPLTQRLDFPKSKSATITTGESDKYLIVQVGFSIMDIFISEGQIEKGSTATAYSPYRLQQIPTGFPAINSAGSAYDYIDLNEGKLHQRVGVVDLGTLDWTYNSEYKFMLANVDGKRPGRKNIIISRYNLSPIELWQQDTDGVYGGNQQNNIIYIKDLNYSDPAAFKVAISGVMLHYELATPTTEPVTIPEPLQEWLPVEPGGTVTFKNADESKQLAVPNSVSWVRKLNEVK